MHGRLDRTLRSAVVSVGGELAGDDAGIES
jgi:hypothetical protein